MTNMSKDNPLERRRIEDLQLDMLLLDQSNPRFGTEGQGSSQEQILDHIVFKFGVDDVLSSLAVNGYFESEPIVCRRTSDPDKYVVLEGNRRLAACLILARDPRARNHEKRSKNFGNLWKRSGTPIIDPIPAIIFEQDEQEKGLLSYLGVRHIASSQPWDSYAKAAWVAQVVEAGQLDVESVARMIGDQYKTINRLLQGYYVVRQLIDEGKFVPQNSVRSGRGSVTEYPFSWVYTILGYATVQQFLEIASDAADRSPIPPERLDAGGLLLKAMFGDKSRGKNSAVGDSRQLGALAGVFASVDKVRLLEQGKTVDAIESLTQPIDQRLSDGLGDVREILGGLVAGLSENEIEQEDAAVLLPMSGGARKLATSLDTSLREIAFGKDAAD